jgi:hypothetical protein
LLGTAGRAVQAIFKPNVIAVGYEAEKRSHNQNKNHSQYFELICFRHFFLFFSPDCPPGSDGD